MPPDDVIRGLQRVMEEARRVGLRLDRPDGMGAFLSELSGYIAQQAAVLGLPDPDGLEPWQREAVTTFWKGLAPVVAETLFPRLPQTALLVTFVDDRAGTVAV